LFGQNIPFGQWSPAGCDRLTAIAHCPPPNTFNFTNAPASSSNTSAVTSIRTPGSACNTAPRLAETRQDERSGQHPLPPARRLRPSAARRSSCDTPHRPDGPAGGAGCFLDRHASAAKKRARLQPLRENPYATAWHLGANEWLGKRLGKLLRMWAENILEACRGSHYPQCKMPQEYLDFWFGRRSPGSDRMPWQRHSARTLPASAQPPSAARRYSSGSVPPPVHSSYSLQGTTPSLATAFDWFGLVWSCLLLLCQIVFQSNAESMAACFL
jgi:hypothetical protein